MNLIKAMRNNILNRDKWRDQFNLKIEARRAVSYTNSLATQKLTGVELKGVYNDLYRIVSSGGEIVRSKSGKWFIEAVDLERFELNSLIMESLVSALDEKSKSYIGLDKLSDFSYSSYESLLRVIPDFPKTGIQFIDWLPIMNDHIKFTRCLSDLASLVKDLKFTKIAALEARGFLLGVPLATLLGVDFVPIRKKGKLPGDTITKTYSLEYGQDTIEIQSARISSNDSVLIVDDLLATGGTINAAIKTLS